ncbi:Uncharacterized conserved protein, DUF427 family [Actinacidiphila yanglinensis]|uniref:Uncharacterized conserved protein, DUF427 family n=1 Tax=Actinacidiphila yanglinensis TaxID=310779 RepID=A0A1H6DHU8_9ACTN|nr:DUF427 domain-containing protein [Actinacidiphila yanglinensis]SEG84799.1 Uncharacterized conserved protein, DUF427 family [Actinacidiphila yanglinensis]
MDDSRNYPGMIVPVGHVEPSPRRVRGLVGGRCVFDTTDAKYVWAWPGYPQYCIPLRDIAEGLLTDEGKTMPLGIGGGRRQTLKVDGLTRSGAAWVWDDTAPEEIRGSAGFRWEAIDAWFEEDEQVFVHPRSPYTRVDALRSGRTVRIEVDGEVIADAPSTVMVFETGLPTRYYLDRVHVDWNRMVPTATVTSCPYKGRTSGYWSVRTSSAVHSDLAWAYDFPTRQLSPIAGLVAFYNEHVDLFLDGERLPRPAEVNRAQWEKERRA